VTAKQVASVHHGDNAIKTCLAECCRANCHHPAENNCSSYGSVIKVTDLHMGYLWLIRSLMVSVRCRNYVHNILRHF